MLKRCETGLNSFFVFNPTYGLREGEVSEQFSAHITVMIDCWVTWMCTLQLVNDRNAENSCPMHYLITSSFNTPFPFGRICFVVLVMRKGGESSWIGPWHLGCTLEVFHMHSYQNQFIQPGLAECFFCVFSLGLCFVCSSSSSRVQLNFSMLKTQSPVTRSTWPLVNSAKTELQV